MGALIAARMTHGFRFVDGPQFVTSQRETRDAKKVGQGMHVSLWVFPQIVEKSCQYVTRTKRPPPGSQMGGVSSRFDQLPIVKHGVLKVPWNHSIGSFHAVQGNHALNGIAKNANNLGGGNQFLNTVTRFSGGKIGRSDFAHRPRPLGVGEMSLVPTYSPMKMNVEKPRLLRALGQGRALPEYFVQPGGSGSRRTDDEEGGKQFHHSRLTGKRSACRRALDQGQVVGGIYRNKGC